MLTKPCRLYYLNNWSREEKWYYGIWWHCRIGVETFWTFLLVINDLVLTAIWFGGLIITSHNEMPRKTKENAKSYRLKDCWGHFWSDVPRRGNYWSPAQDDKVWQNIVLLLTRGPLSVRRGCRLVTKDQISYFCTSCRCAGMENPIC